MSEPEEGATTKKVKKSDKPVMAYVREVLRTTRFAQVGDIIYARKEGEAGWHDVTADVQRRAADSSHKCPRRAGIMSALEPFIAVPPANAAVCTPFCEYQFPTGDETRDEGDRFEGEVHTSHWRPKQIATTAVVFDDGVYDAESHKWTKWDGDMVFGPTISLSYSEVRDALVKPTARYDEFINNLMAAIPNPDTLWYFQKVMSSLLQPHVPQKQGIFFNGPSGARKSTIGTALLCAPGGYAGMSIESIDDLANNRFAQANLIGKFANLSDDPDGMTPKLTGWFKRFTGSSIQRGEFKFAQSRSYPVTAKLVVCCNQIPRMGDASDAVWSRLQVFNFERKGDAAVKYDTNAADNIKLGVPYWSDRGTRACICQWLLRGLEARLTEGMVIPSQVRQWNLDAIAESDPLRGALVGLFIRTDDKAAFTPTEDIIAALGAEGIKVNGITVASYMDVVYRSKTETMMVKQADGNLKPIRGYKNVCRKV